MFKEQITSLRGLSQTIEEQNSATGSSWSTLKWFVWSHSKLIHQDLTQLTNAAINFHSTVKFMFKSNFSKYLNLNLKESYFKSRCMLTTDGEALSQYARFFSIRLTASSKSRWAIYTSRSSVTSASHSGSTSVSVIILICETCDILSSSAKAAKKKQNNDR